MTLNPDFRQADIVVPPADMQMGWTDGTLSEQEALDKESRDLDALQEDLPVAFRSRGEESFDTKMFGLFQQFQRTKGRFEGSMDLTLLDEFVIQKPLLWLPQIIGSCVVSNTLRPWVTRLMFQVSILRRPQEYLGRQEFGKDSYSFYGPFSYGCMRKRGGLRRGDGGFCAPMAESLMKDGVLSCSTPALLTLLKSRGLDDPKDLPEPQGRAGAALYREFGEWQHIEALRQYADYRLLESPRITSAEQLWDWHGLGKTIFVCSMEAIRKKGEHKDGFVIHERDPYDQWAHNMSSQGRFVSSDGERWFRWSNESWGEKHVYNRHFDEVARSFNERRLTVQGIGDIDGPASAPPTIA